MFSPFERQLAGEREVLAAAQFRGLALFTRRAGRTRCHGVEGGALTNGESPAVKVAPGLALRLAATAREVSRMTLDERRAAVPSGAEVAGQGRYVAVTAPSMHGGVPTRAQAVERELYSRTGEGARVGKLTPTEQADLVDFLQTLTSPARPGAPTGAPDAATSVHSPPLTTRSLS
ncbi:hypothetical protein [Myxococcus sp. RHSTA-1-4]|uniref:hypothetical protein n=1 Tax=Myxococcus sp. RHSTA-1-4 TaxID=2874601 RepID=UPI001CBD8630|nr:hypothetical protein [Myxococcus sp. RHSTA-1-4]MBZ4423344.1 hypothetical protein [Myxococcus sp. RHSTA-1-4]